MAVSKMAKIRVIALKKEKDEVINFLQKKGNLEIIKIDYNKKTLKAEKEKIDFDFSSVKFAINFLSDFSPEKISLKDKIRGKKVDIKESDFSNFLNSYKYQNIISETQKIQIEISQITSKIIEIKKNIFILKPWISIDNNLISETKNNKIIFVKILEKKYKNLVEELNKFKLLNIEIINKVDKNLYIEIIFNKNYKEVELIFDQLGIEKQDLPCFNFSPKDTILKMELEIKNLEKEKEKLNLKAFELSKEVKNLKIIFDILSVKKEKNDTEEKIYETEKTFALTGWIEENYIKNILKEIKNISNTATIQKLNIKENEERPVVIKNNSFWRPFEAVTEIYGLPKHYEIDPTPILAPFFVLFFAISLSDAGYGIILMLLSFIAIKILKVPKSSHNLIRLLGYCGFATFIIGALSGGWLGININSLPLFIRNLQLINPVDNPILVLIISFVIGFIQIIAGLTVALYWKLKSGKIKEAILDHGTWIAFLISICLYYAGIILKIIPNNFTNLIIIFFWIALAAVIYSGGRKQKNPLIKIIIGIGGLYGLIGYLSDVLSYSRLLALGLATGIIAMVVNMMAGIVDNSIPYIGSVLAIIVLIFGHTFNIAINTLGSFIHSGRLQFVEFFPKFMDGGGKRFAPFKRNLKYVDIIGE